jgi:hypothetical protein
MGRVFRRRITTFLLSATSLSIGRQFIRPIHQILYFLLLPQGQGSFLPVIMFFPYFWFTIQRLLQGNGRRYQRRQDISIFIFLHATLILS